MVSYFPSPYQDELLYSVVARYKEHTNVSSSRSLSELFGIENLRMDFYLGKKINALVKHIKWLTNLTEDQLIQQHTIYPFIAAFAPEADRKKIYDSILYPKSKINFGKIDGLKTDGFKYCPACVKEDWKIIGETFWRRCHNIPFMKTCVRHKCNLEKAETAGDEKTNIVSAESMVRSDCTISYDITSKNLDNECTEILRGDHVDMQFIVANFFATGLVKTSGSRNTVKPNAIDEMSDFICQNYQYLNHLCPILAGQLHHIVNAKWKGSHPAVILLLEKFLQKITETNIGDQETHLLK